MVELIVAAEFEKWQAKLKDTTAKQMIAARLRRVALGHFGDMKSVGSEVYELRIFYGPGYRLYITRRGEEVVILLCGGDKSTQQKDIAKAKAIAENWR